MKTGRSSHRQWPALGRSAGFTLLEVLIALSVLGLLAVLAYSAFSPAFTFYQRMETVARLKSLRTAIERAYQAEEIKVAAGSSAQLEFLNGTIQQVIPDAARLCPSGAATFAPIGRYLSTSAGDAFRDGHGRGLCVFVSSPLSSSVNGVSVPYYAVAVVSAGQDGTVAPNTALSAVGALTLDGDDRGFLIDGRLFARERVAVTDARMQKIADAYASYFTTRYLANTSRDISINYFASTDASGTASSRWDSTGSMPTSGGAGRPMQEMGADLVLGLSASDVRDAWDQEFRLDNSSSAVRHPGNDSAALQAPPYTARISTVIPGGGELARTVVGGY